MAEVSEVKAALCSFLRDRVLAGTTIDLHNITFALRGWHQMIGQFAGTDMHEREVENLFANPLIESQEYSKQHDQASGPE
jgi:hypothetical protein